MKLNGKEYEKVTPPRFVSVAPDAKAAIDEAGRIWQRVEAWPDDLDADAPAECWMRLDLPGLVEVK